MENAVEAVNGPDVTKEEENGKNPLFSSWAEDHIVFPVRVEAAIRRRSRVDLRPRLQAPIDPDF